MANATFDAERRARERLEALENDLRAVLNPFTTGEAVMEAVKSFERKVAAQASLAVNVIDGLRARRREVEMSAQLESDIERAQLVGVSPGDIRTLLGALDLDSTERRELNRAVDILNTKRQALAQQRSRAQREQESLHRLDMERRRNAERRGPDMGR